MTVRIPAQAVADAGTAAPDLADVLLALSGPESSWNPGAVGDDGSSAGYLQLHQSGRSARYPSPGLGDGHPWASLFDGVTNYRIGAAAIRDRLARNGGNLYDALGYWSTRETAWALLARIRAEGVEPVGAATAGPAPASRNLAVLGVAAALLIVLLGR